MKKNNCPRAGEVTLLNNLSFNSLYSLKEMDKLAGVTG